MSEQDPLSTYSLWAKHAAIVEEPSDCSTKAVKANGAEQSENMNERRRGNFGTDESSYVVKPCQLVKQVPRRTRILPSSDSDDAILYADEGTQTALGSTPPQSQFTGRDDEYASTTRKLARAGLGENGATEQKNAIKAAKSKRDNEGAAQQDDAKAAKELGKQSWSRRALARTRDILSITAKEPSTLAFEEYRNKEFKRAGVKAGDNAAAKLHVSSQKLPPEAPKVQSKEPPPVPKSLTDANTTANKSVGRFSSSQANRPPGNFGGRGKSSSAHSLASSGSRGSSVILASGSARVSFTGSGSGSVTSSEIGQPSGPGRLMHSQTDGSTRVGTATSSGRDIASAGGSTRVGTATSSGRGMTPIKLNEKQKAAAIDDRW